MTALVIGAGLAGSEAAWQLAERGVPVRLYDMKPKRMTPAHASPLFAELVCSNSLRSNILSNGAGLLKEELRVLNSLVIKAADACRVPAGGALAVDRNHFSQMITDALTSHPLIEIVCEEVTQIPESPVIIATGPLTSEALTAGIAKLEGLRHLSFYDASAPIITADSLRMEAIFRQSRYEKGNDYLNCALNQQEYDTFYDALLEAQTVHVHGFEEEKVFEGCMPIESMARRGRQTLAFGPLRPVGLKDPRTGKRAHAIVQLRQENEEGSLYNIVGFQTRLKQQEQKRVFGLIPGLENACYARYGRMHRNTFINSPGFLNNTYRVILREALYFAGQITGTEGYVEAVSGGMTAGINLARHIKGKSAVHFPAFTMIGALAAYISRPNPAYQPMNGVFGLIEPLENNGAAITKKTGKSIRHMAIAQASLTYLNKECQDI